MSVSIKVQGIFLLKLSIVKTNMEKSSTGNEYACLSHQIEYEHSHRDSQVSLFDIPLYVGQSQSFK